MSLKLVTAAQIIVPQGKLDFRRLARPLKLRPLLAQAFLGCTATKLSSRHYLLQGQVFCLNHFFLAHTSTEKRDRKTGIDPSDHFHKKMGKVERRENARWSSFQGTRGHGQYAWQEGHQKQRVHCALSFWWHVQAGLEPVRAGKVQARSHFPESRP